MVEVTFEVELVSLELLFDPDWPPLVGDPPTFPPPVISTLPSSSSFRVTRVRVYIQS